jgi:WD repeat-containing protein 76
MMSNELSEYEKQRLENIKQNQEILKSLNIKGIVPEELKKPTKSTTSAKKSRSSNAVKPSNKAVEEPLARRISSRLLKKTSGFEGLDEDYVKIEPEEFVSLPAEPAKPKRIIGKIPFDPEEGATSGFLELTGKSLNTANPQENDHKRPESGFEDGLEIQNELSVVKIMRERIYSLAVHPDPCKVLIAAGGKFGELAFLDATEASHPEGLSDRQLPDAKEYHPGIYSFRPHTGSISNLRYNPANPVQLFSTSYDNIVRCLDITNGAFEELYNFGEDSRDVITGFDLDVGGNVFYFSDTDGMFRWSDRRESGDKLVKEIRLHEKKIGCVSVCNAGRYLATASNDGSVGLWDLRKLQASPASQDAIPESLHTLTFRRSVTSVYFNPLDSNKLMSTCYDDHVRIHYNLTKSPELHSHSEMSHNNQTGRWITNFKAVWDPKSPNYAVAGNMNRGIDVINAFEDGKGAIVRNITSEYLTAQPAVNAFHPNLDLIASGNASGKIALWSRVM